MRIKKMLTIFLSITLMVTLATPKPVHAGFSGGNASIADVDKAMNNVSNSLLSLKDTASSSDASGLANIFTEFMDVARTTGTIVTAVNGSVLFLRLIGIMEDPTQAKLSSILSKLETIDERLSSMDDKLNDLTTMMSELKASEEFNARTEKAILYEASWRDFEYRYMEDSMDKLISEYSSMLRSGLMEWCNGSRNDNGVDNSQIQVLYQDGRLIYSDSNTAPSNADSWIIIPSTCLPSSFSYDVDSFSENLRNDIVSRLSQIDKTTLVTNNIDVNEINFESLASDAVNTLIYRVASAKVNGNSSFAGEVSRQFSNYCNHFQNSGDGIDAVLKTYYLTHAFEYQVKEDIQDYLDRMIIITGTYGMFTTNVLGMSHLISNDEKLSAVTQMTETINMAQDAKVNSITGYDDYSYITGTRLQYSTVTFEASAELLAHYTMSNTTYKSYKGEGPLVYISSGATPAGDVAMIVLVNTLLSNGITPNHDYLNTNIGNGKSKNYGKIVTGYSGVQNFTIEGKVNLHVKNAFGDYFKNDSTIKSLPGDAENEYVVYRKKISGSLYDPSSRSLTSNTTLCAIAVYGENHALWFTDEGGFMGGPSDSSSFEDQYDKTETGTDTTGKFRTHYYDMYNTYNVLLSIPVKKSNTGIYNPLDSLENDVPYCEYNPNEYEIEEGLLGASASEKEEETLIIAPDYVEPQEEVNQEPVQEVVTEETNFPYIPVIGGVCILGIIIVFILKKSKQN